MLTIVHAPIYPSLDKRVGTLQQFDGILHCVLLRETVESSDTVAVLSSACSVGTHGCSWMR